MNRVIKPRGRPQDRTSKKRILAALSAVTMASTRYIAEKANLSDRCARQHLYELQESYEVERIDEPLRSLAWCLPDRVELARDAVINGPRTKFVPRNFLPGAKASEPEIDEPVTQILRGVGQWSVDHPVTPRSVFDLGGLAA